MRSLTSSRVRPASADRDNVVPLPLWIASTLIACEGVAVLIYAVSEAVYAVGAASWTAVGVAIFLGIYGAALGIGAWALWRLRSAARAPLVLSQLLHLGLAWNMREAPLTWYAIVLAVLSMVAIVAILWPSATRALSD